MYYRHNLDYVYPEGSDEHMITVKHVRDANFDENHRYYNKTFRYLFFVWRIKSMIISSRIWFYKKFYDFKIN